MPDFVYVVALDSAVAKLAFWKLHERPYRSRSLRSPLVLAPRRPAMLRSTSGLARETPRPAFVPRAGLPLSNPPPRPRNRRSDRGRRKAGARILVIDDSPDLGKLIRATLMKANYKVVSARDGESGLKLARKARPDLVVLDIGLPGIDGFEVLKALRVQGGVPVIVLTGSRTEVDCIVGLKLGADDYLTKPISMPELVARVEAVLRRGPRRAPEEGPPERRGALRLSSRTHEVVVGKKALRLTPKEFEILRLLLEARGRVVSRRELLKNVWGYSKDLGMDTRMVDQYVSRIRNKLAAEGRRILTVPTLGYRISS